MKFIKPLSLYQVLMKSKLLEKGRLLGLDVGDKYVGLAVSDPQNLIASPLSVLLRKKNNIELMADDLEKVVSKFSLVGFIVGYPYRIGQKSESDAVHIKKFTDALSRTGKLEGLKYTYWDEGYTSKSEEVMLKPLGLHPVEYKSVVDKFAAVGILQAYLDHINRTKLKLEETS